MAKKNFLTALVKLAEPLFSSSMADRYNHLTDSYEEDQTGDPTAVSKSSVKFVPGTASVKDLMTFRKKPTFKTAPPAESKISPKDYDYLSWSRNNQFQNVAPFIVEHETGGKSLKSHKANNDGTYDYGFFQINDNNLSRDLSGAAVADAFDPIFEKYYTDYKKNYEGKKEGEYTYPTLTGTDSKDVANRRTLLQIPHLDFNSTDKSLSYELAESLYNLRGIGSWSTKDKVISSVNDSQMASN